MDKRSATFRDFGVLPEGLEPPQGKVRSFLSTSRLLGQLMIKAVLFSKALRDESALRRLLQQGSVTGICSESPRPGWEKTLGQKLRKANQGCALSSAWMIEEIRQPPTAAVVTAILWASAGCLTAAIVLAIILLGKAGGYTSVRARERGKGPRSRFLM